MKGIVRSSFAIVLAGMLVLALGGGASGRGAKPIKFSDQGLGGGHFSPQGLTMTLSKQRHDASWRRAQGSVTAHNVYQDEGLFNSGAPATGFDHFKVKLSAGSFHYYCQIHGSKSGGMAGTIAVEPELDLRSPTRAKVTWAYPDSHTGDRYDVDWRVRGSKRWKHWKRATRTRSATFGEGSSPVTVDPSKTYQLRVRSRDHKHPSRVSDYSPTVNFKGADFSD